MSTSSPTLSSLVDATLASGTLGRILLSGAEGLGRTHHLAGLSRPVLRIDTARGAVAGTLRALLDTSGGEEAAWQRLLAAPQLAGLPPERARLAAELLWSLLGLARPDAVIARLDDASRHEGATLELARWVTERAQATGGLVLAFDDAHLADDDGVAFIELLAQREEPAPLALVVAFDDTPGRASPAFRAKLPGWQADARWSPVALAPLPDDAVAALLAEAPAARRAELVARARGNPGLALGLLALLRGDPALEPAAWPATLDGLRVARVRAHGEGVTRVASTLAAIGGCAPVAALSSVDPGLAALLHQAVLAGLVVLERRGPLEVARFSDARLVAALAGVLPAGQALGAQLMVGAWAVQALEVLEPTGFAVVADVLVPLALPALDGLAGSLWLEAWGGLRPHRADGAARLEQAAKGATGVRRLVLLRRVAEARLLLGLPAEALALLHGVVRPALAAPEPLPGTRVGQVLAAQPRGVLERWESLSADEALAAVELVRAECHSHLVKRDETQRAFEELERRLTRLKGPAVAHLWVRWAKGWSWFLCEILGRAADAVKACERVRQRVPPKELAADEDAIAFVRAEEVAVSSCGDFTRASALTDELVALADRAGRLRDACLGWNARGLLHYGRGELTEAKAAFERSLSLARATGWLRREAITLHNLCLVLTEEGALDAAFAGETQYAHLSVLIGNHAGKAEAPLVLAGVELARGRLPEAEALLATARKVSEANGWDMLTAWGRALAGRLRLLRWKRGGDSLELTRARNDLQAALEVLEERSLAWSEELDPAEVTAHYAWALRAGGQGTQAQAAVTRLRARLPTDNLVSHAQLDLVEALLRGEPAATAVAWFEARGFTRRAALWRDLA
jgi:tetratricopeptide (TPR) repeat protein